MSDRKPGVALTVDVVGLKPDLNRRATRLRQACVLALDPGDTLRVRTQSSSGIHGDWEWQLLDGGKWVEVKSGKVVSGG